MVGGSSSGESKGEECRDEVRERLSWSRVLINSLIESESESGSGSGVEVRVVEDECQRRRL
jgi:hypothetical protein